MAIKIYRRDLPNPVDARDPQTPTLADIAPRDLVLVGRDATLDISDRVLNIRVARTIDGASTVVVTVSDPGYAILNSPAIKGRGEGNLYCQAILDSLVFQLVGIGTKPRQTILTFESETIHRLRGFDDPKSMTRSTITRAMFIKWMCDEAGVDFYSPELNVRQKIAPEETQTERDRKREPGFGAHANITVKGVKATRVQLNILARLLAQADKEDAPYLPTLAMICSTIGESTVSFAVNKYGYGGPLQAHRDNLAPTDVEQQAHYFLRGGKGFQAGGAIALSKTLFNPGEIALMVEGSRSNFGSQSEAVNHYDKHRAEAAKIIAAYNGTDAATETRTYVEPYQFRRGQNGKREDSWTCMRRLADEVKWYVFEVAGTVYFMSPEQLKRSRPRMLVAPGADGIDDISVAYDTSPKVDNKIDVVCHAATWAAPPGSVAEVQGLGPIDGRWLVQDITRDSLSSTRTTVTLARFARKNLPEPAHTSKTSSTVDQPVGTPITPSSAADLRGSGGLHKPVETNLATDKNGWSGPGGHDGIDLICGVDAPIYAICDAKVIDVRAGGWWGKGAPADPELRGRGDGIIQLECLVNVGPFRKGMHFGYGHAEGARVKVGDTVRAGQVIGRAGLANAYHVHFMVNGGGTTRGTGDRDPRPFVVYATQYRASKGPRDSGVANNP
jgi:murein DD-endopeptidase MepM/ murein hydrolase activator NlpD